MCDFYIDSRGDDGKDEGNDSLGANWSDDEDAAEEILDLRDELPELTDDKEAKSERKSKFSLDDNYLITSYTKGRGDEEVLSPGVDKLLEKSALQPGLEREHAVSSIKTKQALKIERRRLREKTKGKKWFDIPATEVTDEIKTDFALLKMRSVLDSKHVYKKNDITGMPKYFQVGTVIESPADFYGGRIPKAQRKKTIVDELLADAQFKTYQKKKYKEIMDVNRRLKRTKKVLDKEKQKKKGKLRKNK